MLHIGQQNVAVDIRNNNIKDTVHVRQDMHVPMKDFNILNAIQTGIMATVLNAPFINVVANHKTGAMKR